MHYRTPAVRALHRRVTVLPFVASCLASLAIAQSSPPAPRTALPEEVVQLSNFTVTSERDTGYESMQTTSGMRTVQELKNVANSISVVNSQLIQDLGAMTIEDMTKWTVAGESNPDPTTTVGVPRLVFRGIANNYAIRNGWIWYSPIDAYSTERIELLRGPNAFLYGEADLGGSQNQITKQGRFTRDFTSIRLMTGSYDLLRLELDANRRISDKLAYRVAAMQTKNNAWWNHGRRDSRGVYGAVNYRPFASTTIRVNAEYYKSTDVRANGLFADAYSYTGTTTLTNTSGVTYLPVNGTSYRLTGRIASRGPGASVIDPLVVPREYQFTGPNSTTQADQKSVTFELEQAVGQNLHLMLSGNFYKQFINAWGSVGKNITRDLNPTLPGGLPNPYFNQLYTDYYRTQNIAGNIVRDIRFSAVYDLQLGWMKQQLVVNAQQHQDNPGAKYPKMGEYVDPSNPNFVGTVQTAATQAAFLANRTTFGNNRLMRRYYLKDGDSGNLTGSVGAVPGLSAYYPDFSNQVAATGAQLNRRFYTPSIGAGAAGTYFNDHLHTLIGVRRDAFNMRTTNGVPRPLANTWIVDTIPGAFSAPQFVRYAFTGTNYGGVLRINQMIAFSFNQAKSYRLSLGDGGDGYIIGTKQGVPYGEGRDFGLRLTFLGGKIELNNTYYDNYQPNARVTPLLATQQNVKDELTAIFPSTFNSNGTDLQKITTKGVETELVANLTSDWRLMFNFATNEIITEDRLPQLKAFQAQARALGKTTPLLDAFMPTFPEGVPTAGYTKTRANIFTRYDFKRGPLKGLYLGGGANWRGRTFRGNADLNQDGFAENLWSPSYTLFSLLAGYQTRILNHRTVVALNVDNLFDRDYYRSGATNSGSWGDPRSFRLNVTTEF